MSAWLLAADRDEAEIYRSPPHLYRLDARQDHSVDEEEAKKSNPLFLLDRVDKMGTVFRVRYALLALLEVLDPAQPSTFTLDHYLEVEYDLGPDAIFIHVAELTLNIPAAADGPARNHPYPPATPKTRSAKSATCACSKAIMTMRCSRMDFR